MKTKTFITGIVTAVVAAVLFSFGSEFGIAPNLEREAGILHSAPEQDPETELVRFESAESEAETVDESGGDRFSALPGQELNELVGRKMRADSALEFENAIQDAERMNLDVANDWRTQLVVLCHPSQAAIFDREAENSAFAARGQEFCAGYTPDPELLSRHLEKYYAGNIPSRRLSELDRLLERELSADREQFDDYIKRTLRRARVEEEVLAVADYLAQMFAEGQLVLWQPVAAGRAISNERVVDLQSLAIELYACRRFLNCGPRSIKMLMNCTYVPICEAWWTYEDFVAATLAPYELAYIHRVISSIGA
jgi:hypothetical protein